MITGDIKNIKIARKYSNALLEAANENNITDKIKDNLVFIVETINSNPQLKDFLYSPIIHINDKKEVIDKLFSIHTDKITIDFLYILTDENRLNIIEEILNQFSKSYNLQKNIVKPNVISAIELNEEQKNRLIEKLENKLSKKVIPEFYIDKQIIGGLIVEIEDTTIDCSLRTKFSNMKKQLTKGN